MATYRETDGFDLEDYQRMVDNLNKLANQYPEIQESEIFQEVMEIAGAGLEQWEI